MTQPTSFKCRGTHPFRTRGAATLTTLCPGHPRSTKSTPRRTRSPPFVFLGRQEDFERARRALYSRNSKPARLWCASAHDAPSRANLVAKGAPIAADPEIRGSRHGLDLGPPGAAHLAVLWRTDNHLVSRSHGSTGGCRLSSAKLSPPQNRSRVCWHNSC